MLGASRLSFLANSGSAASLGPRTSASMEIGLEGDTKISTTQNKFGGSSIYMDGSGDYIDVTDNGALDFGTGDFTIEWWQYMPTLSANYNAVDLRGGSNGAKILLYSNPTDKYFLYVNSATAIDSGSVLQANAWQHIALSRASASTRLFVDGTQVGSTYSDSNNYAHDEMLIFQNSLSSAYDGQGYVDEFRVSKGHARYSSNFTVPSSAFTADEHTHLLLHGDGDNNSTVILDDGPRTDSAVTVSTFGGNTELSTTQAKFGATSAYYDGEGSVDPDHTVLNIGSGDFTIEFFYYPTDFTSQYGRYFFDTGSGVSSRLNGYFEPGGSTFKLRSGNTQIMSGNHDMSTNQWYHIAFVRKSGTLKYYLNGTEKISVSNSTNFTNNDYKIGSYLTGGPYSIKGYLDEWRQSNVARYSQAFTPTNTAFTADGYTKLLLHFDGSNGATTTSDDA